MVGEDWENWENPELSRGRGQPSPADREAASIIATHAERILAGIPDDARQKLLSDIDRLLNDFAPKIGRERKPIRIGLCTRYTWLPAGGGVVMAPQFDIEFFECEEMRGFRPLVRLLDRISRDRDRALIKAISLIVLRDFGNGDYSSVLEARRPLDVWSARLISRDEHTYKKRQQGGQRPRHARDRARTRVLKMAQRLRRTNVPKDEWVRTIYERMHLGTDDPYPSRDTIRRFLNEAHLLH
jgi:hypothetical protein